MPGMFKAAHRAFQDRFGTRRLADRVVGLSWKSEVFEETRMFIESRDMFFLATVDIDGRPTCSYKGGAPGFVSVVGPHTLAFPSFDGNGMYLSAGNISANPEVGLLFIDFEKGNRLRVQGRASVSDDDPLLRRHAKADLIVRVEVSVLFPNCPRYVHRYRKEAQSAFVPHADREQPLVDWKRLDLVHDALPEQDRAKVEAAGGPITRKEMLRNGQR